MGEKVKYVTVSIPRAVAERIDYYVESLGYWPSRSSFVREAVLDKFSRESQKIVQLHAIAEYDSSSEAVKKEKDAPRMVGNKVER